MPCDGCNKPKTVHITEIKGGKQVDMHYCKDCPYANDGVAGAKSHAPINELLTNFVMSTSSGGEKQAEECPHTGITWAEFRNAGLLGHPENYDLFESHLTPLLQRAHEGATHHVGKVPERRGKGGLPPKRRKTVDLAKLKQELALALEQENYENAAELRDRIREIEGD
ncbi:MAG: UvrB/UvrC motif-containing protein [Planctomycetota bacterium]